MKSVVGGGALGLAAVFSPALSKPAAAVAQSLEDLEADLMICKVSFWLLAIVLWQAPLRWVPCVVSVP